MRDENIKFCTLDELHNNSFFQNTLLSFFRNDQTKNKDNVENERYCTAKLTCVKCQVPKRKSSHKLFQTQQNEKFIV